MLNHTGLVLEGWIGVLSKFQLRTAACPAPQAERTPVCHFGGGVTCTLGIRVHDMHRHQA